MAFLDCKIKQYVISIPVIGTIATMARIITRTACTFIYNTGFTYIPHKIIFFTLPLSIYCYVGAILVYNIKCII